MLEHVGRCIVMRNSLLSLLADDEEESVVAAGGGTGRSEKRVRRKRGPDGYMSGIIIIKN